MTYTGKEDSDYEMRKRRQAEETVRRRMDIRNKAKQKDKKGGKGKGTILGNGARMDMATGRRHGE